MSETVQSSLSVTAKQDHGEKWPLGVVGDSIYDFFYFKLKITYSQSTP